MKAALGVASVLLMQFLVLSAAAMSYYDGGNRMNADAAAYSMVHNTFSDLGRTDGYGGPVSPLSRFLFTFSLALGGGGLAFYHALVPALFRDERTPMRRKLSPRVAGVICGALGAAGGIVFIGIALYPADLFPHRHFLLVYLGFTMFLPAALFGAVAFGISKRFPRHYAVPYFVLSVALVGYLALIYFGPPVSSSAGNVVQVVGQKVIVYLGVACLAATAILCRRRM